MNHGWCLTSCPFSLNYSDVLCVCVVSCAKRVVAFIRSSESSLSLKEPVRTTHFAREGSERKAPEIAHCVPLFLANMARTWSRVNSTGAADSHSLHLNICIFWQKRELTSLGSCHPHFEVTEWQSLFLVSFDGYYFPHNRNCSIKGKLGEFGCSAWSGEDFLIISRELYGATFERR